MSGNSRLGGILLQPRAGSTEETQVITVRGRSKRRILSGRARLGIKVSSGIGRDTTEQRFTSGRENVHSGPCVALDLANKEAPFGVGGDTGKKKKARSSNPSNWPDTSRVSGKGAPRREELDQHRKGRRGGGRVTI